MQRSLYPGAIGALALTLTLALPAGGHGGTYRGPGDLVPPGGGGGGGGAGAPPVAGPTGVPRPGNSGPGPTTGGAPGLTPGGGPPGGGPVTGAATGGVDLTAWDFWWAFNKDPYLNLRSRIHRRGPASGDEDFWLGGGQHARPATTLAPSPRDVRGKVVPALLAALDGERSNDIVGGVLMALAKIGDLVDEDGRASLAPVIEGYLGDPSQEVAETAAVALGVLGSARSVEPLVALMGDRARGRDLVGKTEVPYRTRAFAAYGLGLVGARQSDPELRRTVARELVEVLNRPSFATRDIKVAAITALGLVPLDVIEGDPQELDVTSALDCTRSRQSQLRYLLHYFDERHQREFVRTRHEFVRAHAPTAMARLLDPQVPEALVDEVAGALIEVIGPRVRVDDRLRMSAALALGTIGDADEDQRDQRIRAALEGLLAQGDQQSRRFALIALGQVGGRAGRGPQPLGAAGAVRAAISSRLSKGRLKAWAALALGVHGRTLLDGGHLVPPELMRALRREARGARVPAEAGAYLLALGLVRDVESSELLLEKLDYFAGRDAARGYAAVALGMVGDRRALEKVRGLVESASYRPDLLRQAAVALGLLGDERAVGRLVSMLGEARVLATRSAIASALGAIGDRRCLDPLVEMLADRRLTDTARAFAAVALGIVCEKDELPWNSPIAVGINYRANTVTLIGGGGRGVLDIL